MIHKFIYLFSLKKPPKQLVLLT
nr:unnamed protein product [Callosobruchus analis]